MGCCSLAHGRRGHADDAAACPCRSRSAVRATSAPGAVAATDSCLPPFEPHTKPTAHAQRDPLMRNHGPVVGETQPEPLREGGDDKLHLGEREGIADTEPWATSGGNVGVPRPAGCAGV